MNQKRMANGNRIECCDITKRKGLWQHNKVQKYGALRFFPDNELREEETLIYVETRVLMFSFNTRICVCPYFDKLYYSFK